MDNPNEQSGSSRAELKKQRVTKNQPKLLREGAQRFEEIVNGPAFVDHTHFIKDFLEDDVTKLAIFAPRRFGKSTHLSMVRRFLEIDIDETGEISSSVYGPAKERKNYKLFEKTRIINDASSKELVEAHLGRHPVIHLDFKTSKVKSVETAEEHCRLVVWRAYSDHLYLKTSTKLIPGDEEANVEAQNECKDWCSPNKCLQKNLSTCLENLTKYLYNHCNKTKVYILVDEFDAINASAIHSIAGEPRAVKKLKDICEVLTSLLETVTKGEFANAHVAGVLFTGVAYVCGMGYSPPQFNNFKRLKFLDGDTISDAKKSESREFVPFYGATAEEVEDVINKLVKNKQLVNFEEKQEFLNDAKELDAKKIFDEVESRYNGYCDKKGVRIFCLWSVMKYLQTGEARNYWDETGEIHYMYKILKSEVIAADIVNLIRGGTVTFTRKNKIPIDDILALYEFLLLGTENKFDPNIVYNILMDQGYLTYTEHGSFKLPNAEIEASLFDMIGTFVRKDLNIITKACSILIDGITSSVLNDEKILQTTMSELHKDIDLCMRPLEGQPLNEKIIICVIYLVLHDLKNFDVRIDSAIKDAQGIPIALGRPDVLLLHKNEKDFCILIETKCNNDKDGKGKDKCTSLYALQEARGLEEATRGRTKDYIDPLKNLRREKVLIIGLSVDRDVRVSLSCAAGMDDKIFYKSEKEPTDFPDLFKRYKPVPLPEGK